jgi:hypothetical protein
LISPVGVLGFRARRQSLRIDDNNIGVIELGTFEQVLQRYRLRLGGMPPQMICVFALRISLKL